MLCTSSDWSGINHIYAIDVTGTQTTADVSWNTDHIPYVMLLRILIWEGNWRSLISNDMRQLSGDIRLKGCIK